MCLKYAELEKSLGEIDRAHALYKHSSQFADPRPDPDIWNKWHEFEVQHSNEDTFHEMLRVKRSVSASYSQEKKFEVSSIVTMLATNMESSDDH
ncbi:Pre-mRNA-splicing factor syf1 [Datura stramonium]|uniref:Pre-mRNA-splicing factor syf1 n=1 Tax=Datura stramonium TaxID=4076 RepID=A0ABS8WHN5_DATST|nr:Pre-mRNA-splicing factor syf1 [Datura stramonium]